MKNLFFTFAVAGTLALSLVSCKKDRVCECTDEDGDKTSTEYKKVTKRYMKDGVGCVSTSSVFTYPDGSVSDANVETCEIK